MTMILTTLPPPYLIWKLDRYTHLEIDKSHGFFQCVCQSVFHCRLSGEHLLAHKFLSPLRRWLLHLLTPPVATVYIASQTSVVGLQIGARVSKVQRFHLVQGVESVQ
jgi:hypothetical protein